MPTDIPIGQSSTNPLVPPTKKVKGTRKRRIGIGVILAILAIVLVALFGVLSGHSGSYINGYDYYAWLNSMTSEDGPAQLPPSYSDPLCSGYVRSGLMTGPHGGGPGQNGQQWAQGCEPAANVNATTPLGGG